MKFSVQKSDLVSGLSIVARSASSRTTLPILSNVLIEAQIGRIKLAATNLETGVLTYIKAEVGEEGIITLPANRLSSLVDAMPDKEISVSSDNNLDAKLSCGSFKGTLKGLPADEFPLIPDGTYSDISINGTELKRIIDAVVFCADQKSIGQMIDCVHIVSKGGVLSAYATNRYRLARYVKTINMPDFRVTVPAKNIQEIVKLCGNDPVGLSVNENQAIFSFGSTTVVMQLASGDYPVFDRGYMVELPIVARVNRREFLSSVKGVNVFSRDSNDLITLRPEFGETDRLGVYARSAEMGDANPSIFAIVSGGDFEISMNGKYLQDVLNAIPDKDVILCLKDERTQVMIMGSDDDSAQYLIIPMLLK